MSKVEEVASIEGVPVFSMLMPFSENYAKVRGRVAHCPLCRNEIEGGIETRFLGCNHKHFPNSVCHPECIEEIGGYQAAAEKLKSMNDRMNHLKEELRKEFGAIGWHTSASFQYQEVQPR
ncbi:hypothetical protein [Paenibacillus durus]|uniref:Uncharacterized protein n=1 Tax=Paenibacillus durus ATCC 35681 TaxID=1333534 RepID=A0A0F7FBG5_PAEDU|nr:hypothetical protein [Paenibacillus durus]AKG36118.1 hypothetical protein VK70_17415 [Paenibacillus durus ATCC 35681]